MNFEEVALSTTGIHPAVVTKLDENYKEVSSVPRSEWKDGWNACHKDITMRAYVLGEWFSKLTDREKGIVEYFLEYGLSFDFEKDEKEEYKVPMMKLNCSDTFCWGCSDSEPVTMDELVQLSKAGDSIFDGTNHNAAVIGWIPTAFACIKRDTMKVVDELKAEEPTILEAVDLLKKQTSIKKAEQNENTVS